MPEYLDDNGNPIKPGGPVYLDDNGEPLGDSSPAPQAGAVGRFVSNAADVLNPVAIAKGAYGMVRHPVDTYNTLVDASAQQFGKAGEAFRQGRYSEGLGHGAAGLLPGIGPAAAEAGEQIGSGDVAGGLGRGVALAATPALAKGTGRIVSGIAKPAANRLMQSALKPTAALVKARAGAGYGSKAAIADAVLKEGRLVTRGGLDKAQVALDATDDAAQAALRGGTGRGVTVDPFAVTRAIDDQAGSTFGKQINAAPDVDAVRAVHDSFAKNPYVSDPVTGMAPLPADLAHEFAMNTGKNLKGKFGRLGGATVEAEKAGREALTRSLRDQIPELKSTWDTEARQITARDALEGAVARVGNRDPIGLTGIVGMVKSPALAAGALADRSAALKSLVARSLHRTGGGTVAPQALRAAILARLLGSEPTEDAQGR